MPFHVILHYLISYKLILPNTSISLSAISYKPSAISYKLSAISYKLAYKLTAIFTKQSQNVSAKHNST